MRFLKRPQIELTVAWVYDELFACKYLKCNLFR